MGVISIVGLSLLVFLISFVVVIVTLHNLGVRSEFFGFGLSFILSFLVSFYVVKMYIRFKMNDSRTAEKLLEKQIKKAERLAEKEFYDKVLIDKFFDTKYGRVQILEEDLRYFQELLKDSHGVKESQVNDIEFEEFQNRLESKERRLKAEEKFYAEKIESIPVYGSTDGLHVVENLGFSTYEEDYESKAYSRAKHDAYGRGANALLVSDASVSKHTTVNSYFNGIGAKRGIETKTHKTFNLSVNFIKVENPVS